MSGNSAKLRQLTLHCGGHSGGSERRKRLKPFTYVRPKTVEEAFGISNQEITITDGALTSQSSSKKESLSALLRRTGRPHIEAKAEAKPGSEKEAYSMNAFGAQFAEVHVDEDLGQVKVARLLGCFGAGKILNAKTARSQLMGGMIWDIGMALYEESSYGSMRLGRWVNNNLAEYHVPVNADVGHIDAIWVEEEDPHINPIGAKGIGEIGITGASAAVANAIFNATGKRVRDLPITLDKLLLMIPIREIWKETGVSVSALGLGGHHLGQARDENAALQIIHEALDNGITFYDNCWEYHLGLTELFLGKGLAGRRNQVFLMTKVCTHGREKRLAMEMLEQSLRRLRTDHLDLWQIHGVSFDNDPGVVHSPEWRRRSACRS